MQLYAFDVNNRLVFSSLASKQKNYHCPECKSIVRLRGGLQRQNHFYHVEAVRACRQSGKSGQHLAVQYYFLDRLPKGECLLEHPFPEISRIADVVWLPHKIIFEVQCSFISSVEVQARNNDYASLGYQVVWILHDNRYNKPFLSAMELYLQDKPHYFTNMRQNGEGFIYDQFALVQTTKRIYHFSPLPIEVDSYRKDEESLLRGNLLTIKNRRQWWNGYFYGDLTHLICNEGLANCDYLIKAAEIEKHYYKQENLGLINCLTNFLMLYVVRPYRLLFQILLERCSK